MSDAYSAGTTYDFHVMIDYSSLFPQLRPEAKAWAYVASRPLSSEESDALGQTIASFQSQWSSHGRVVHSNFMIAYKQVLILSADVDQGEISGCGIDKSLHLLDSIAESFGFTWANTLSIVYKVGDETVQITDRASFRRLVQAEEVNALTPVFDFSVSTLNDIRRGLFELPAGSSWHQRVFRMSGVEHA